MSIADRVTRLVETSEAVRIHAVEAWELEQQWMRMANYQTLVANAASQKAGKYDPYTSTGAPRLGPIGKALGL